MCSGDGPHRRTRREFFQYAAGLGAGAAAYAALGPRFVLGAGAQAAAPGRVKVLLEDLADASAADFARGQARGVAVASSGGRGLLRGTRGGEFVSGVLELPFPATHLGLHWVMPQDGPGDVALELRTSDGSGWSEWQPVQLESLAELAQGKELFAALVEGGRGRRVQYRISFLSDHASTVERVTVTAINSVDGPVLAATAGEPLRAPFTAVDGSPFTVVTRAGWGCDETLRFSGDAESWREMYVPAKKLVVHHTATSNRYTDGAAEVRAIYAYHARTQGWGDIGYNSLIDRYGNIYEGRHGRGEGSDREILSADVVAGHVLGHNYGSSGIAAIGDSSRGDWKSPDPLVASLEELVVFECGRHFIDPAAVSDFLKSDGSWHAGLDSCSGHYQSDSTACPGTALKKLLPALRSSAASRLKGDIAPVLTSSAPRDPAPTSLSFQWSSSTGGPYLYCLEGWSKNSGEDDITYLSGHEPAGYGDPLAMKQAWVGTTSTSAAFSGLKPGHYTMHLRTLSGSDADRYEANLTFQVKEGTPAVGVAVAGINPASVQSGSSVNVIITGRGFSPGAAVSFQNGDGSAPIASGVSVSVDGTSITAQISAFAQTSKRPLKDRVWDVRVTNTDGTSGVLANGFTVTA